MIFLYLEYIRTKLCIKRHSLVLREYLSTHTNPSVREWEVAAQRTWPPVSFHPTLHPNHPHSLRLIYKYQAAAVTRLLNRQIRTTEFFVTIAVQFRLWHLDQSASGRRLGWGWGLVFAHDNHNCNIMQPSLELTNPSSSYACALRSLAEVWHTACFSRSC